ncbi:DegV family protein [[Mycoplasma] gypis]|uniref:DegV family protein n=1 Tax=[Mycoplasma] gypis TaxID=92404 RepID=A0ABZ2RQ58_9BACT|nr:DegV family protein [[Mycoplasma] gypis]MBN0919499.1 DegV family protein [[Mycoplasma] gypis]
MKKIGVILDSYSGFTAKELESEGFLLLPLQLNIDGKNYLEGYDIEGPEVLMHLRNNKEAKTSLPPYFKMEEVMQYAYENYDKVLVLTINENLSSEYSFLKTISQGIGEEKFIIFSNNFNAKQYIIAAKRAKEMLENGASDTEVIQFLKEYNESSLNYIIPVSLNPFIKGGRLKGYKKVLMTSLKLVPILKNNEGVTFDGVKRTVKLSIQKTVEKLLDFIGGDKNIQFYNFWIIQTGDGQIVEDAKTILAKHNIVPSFIALGSASTMIHAGIDSISIGVSKKI